ncbi:MAG: [FeFe] hydrogenase H-cluster maturation GTPase HydF, partial [Bacilli bacterium]
ACFVSTINNIGYDYLLNQIASHLKPEKEILLKDIKLKYHKIVHVIPIDEAAPQGRLILPQMQLLRECLDLNIISIVLKPEQLKEYLDSDNNIDLIVCDSQIFKEVSQINKQGHLLTSYSILQARSKGDLEYLIKSLDVISSLKEDAHILIMESCSHNVAHDDIGQVKIPMILKKLISNNIKISFKMGYDFTNIKEYDFIVHCGSCMLPKQVMEQRIQTCLIDKVAMSNYGLIIAYYHGILEEATMFMNKTAF